MIVWWYTRLIVVVRWQTMLVMVEWLISKGALRSEQIRQRILVQIVSVELLQVPMILVVVLHVHHREHEGVEITHHLVVAVVVQVHVAALNSSHAFASSAEESHRQNDLGRLVSASVDFLLVLVSSEHLHEQIVRISHSLLL